MQKAINEARKGIHAGHGGPFDLTGCEIYTTGEPCHMCLCACMWANISKIYYGCTIKDNDRIGFRDDKFNDIFGGRESSATISSSSTAKPALTCSRNI